MITLSGIYGKALRKAAITCAGLLLCAAFGGSALAGDLPKKGTYSSTWVFSGPYTVIEVGDNGWAGISHFALVVWNDAGEGVLHDMTGDCVGMGLEAEWSGYCSWADADGDKIFDHWKDVGERGTRTLLGGTGKYEGIQGTDEYEFVYTPDAPEGTFHGHGRANGSYTLP